MELQFVMTEGVTAGILIVSMQLDDMIQQQSHFVRAAPWLDMAPTVAAVSLFLSWDDLASAAPKQPAAHTHTVAEAATRLGLWRTIIPTVVRVAPSDTAPELAHLPAGAALWPIQVKGRWIRVHGRAGADTYIGYVHSEAIAKANN
jgi:hypothetical protein